MAAINLTPGHKYVLGTEKKKKKSNTLKGRAMERSVALVGAGLGMP